MDDLADDDARVVASGEASTASKGSLLTECFVESAIAFGNVTGCITLWLVDQKLQVQRKRKAIYYGGSRELTIAYQFLFSRFVSVCAT